MDQIGLRDVIPTLFPSKRSKEGVRGPAAVDHERIDRFSNLLEHVRTRRQVYENILGVSIGQDGMKSINRLGAAHADLFPPNQVKFGQPGDAIDARIHL